MSANQTFAQTNGKGNGFVAPITLASSGGAKVGKGSVCQVICVKVSVLPESRVVMGYGSYSYITDKTQGHTNQYYVDKFRRVEDLAKFTSPLSDDDAAIGRTAKGTVKVPKQGIPEPRDSALPPIDPTAPEDPRIAEAEGSVYPWDSSFQNSEFDSSTYADINDEEVSSDAFYQFRKAMTDTRGGALSDVNSRLKYRNERFKAGLDDKYILTLDGQHDINHMITEKMLSPSVITHTETGYPQPVSALDFI